MSNKTSAFETYKGPLLTLFGMVILLGLAGTMVYYGNVLGQTSQGNMSGYAWSDTIGWISFNSLNHAGANPYSVTVERMSGQGANIQFTGDSTHYLSGYAWSDNIGWISFGCGGPDGSKIQCSTWDGTLTPVLPQYPSGGAVGERAQLVVGTGGEKRLQGWARACSVFVSGCSGNLRGNEYRGGWDGWISLSGCKTTAPACVGGLKDYEIVFDNTNHVKRVSAPGNVYTNRFAWGADVVGWIDFRPDGQDGVYLGDPDLSVSCSVTYDSSSRTATWIANVSGRSASALEYKWYGLTDGGTNYGTTAVPPYHELPGPDSFERPGMNTATPPSVTYPNETHRYYRYVATRENSSSPWFISGTCMDGSNPGVYVRSTIPNFDISAAPDMNVEFLSADTVKDTSPTYVTITPYDVSGQPRVSPVVISVVDSITNRSTSESGVNSIKIGTPANNVNATVVLCGMTIGVSSCAKSISLSDFSHVISLKLNIAKGLSNSGADVKIRGVGGGLTHDATVKLNTTTRGTGFEQF
ncbi:MAG: hypothetical protein HZB12_01995 [Candidatus Yonathbacteria bacterium]|nr:hypothetical protein [Candidatus Yonathbacteria bacterium]